MKFSPVHRNSTELIDNQLITINRCNKLEKASVFSEDNSWGAWIYFAVVLLAQAAFLSIPVEMAHKRPVTKRTVIPLVIAASLMMGLLGAGAAFSVNETLTRGDSNTSNTQDFVSFSAFF